MSSTSLTASIPATDVASAGTLAITVFTPTPGGGTSGTVNLTVNPAPPSTGPTLRVNGSSSPITVAGGSTITVNVSNGPGNMSDWVMMVPAGAPAATWGPDYKYLSGTRTRPATGMTSATITFAAPTAGGNFEFRFYQNDTFTLLATSPVVTVTALSTSPSVAVNGSSGPITVAAGSTIAVTVSNGPGNISDWVMIVPAGAPAGTWGPDYKYLSGTRTRPATGMTAATINFTAPAGGGNFELRFYQNDTFTLLATSPQVTVTP